MEFCTACDNMLLIKQNDQSVVSVCNFCNTEFPAFGGSKSKLISRTFMKHSTSSSHEPFVSDTVFEDPTLPISDTISCTNQECTKPKDAPARTIYIKYDASNQKYLYACSYCRTFWTRTM